MWFKTMSVFNLDTPFSGTAGSLEDMLSSRRLIDCPSLSYLSSGWVPVNENGVFCESNELDLLFSMGTQERILPAGVIKREVDKQAAEFAAQTGFALGKKAKRDLKEKVISELLPKAFIKSKMISAWMNRADKLLLIDSASAKVADSVTAQLRNTLGDLSIVPWSTKVPVADTLTSWVLAGEAPGNFAIEDECQMQGGPEKRTVRFARHPLDDARVREHLNQGLKVTKLSLTWRDLVTFTVDTNLHLSKIRSLVTADSKPEDPGKGESSVLADFMVMAGIMKPLLKDLVSAFQVEMESSKAAPAVVVG